MTSPKQPPQAVCVQCPNQKQDCNHWFVAVVTPDGITFYVWTPELSAKYPSLCGQSCATKFFQQWMDRPEAKA